MCNLPPLSGSMCGHTRLKTLCRLQEQRRCVPALGFGKLAANWTRGTNTRFAKRYMS